MQMKGSLCNFHFKLENTHTHTHTHIYIYMYIYIYTENDSEIVRDGERKKVVRITPPNIQLKNKKEIPIFLRNFKWICNIYIYIYIYIYI